MIDTTKMINIEDLPSSNLEYIEELKDLAIQANNFIYAKDWCKNILQGKLDRGWGYIIAVFFFVIEPILDDYPDKVWIIVGDLPPAYISADYNPNGACAIEAYVMEMERWVDNVLNGRSLEDIIPVNAPPTVDYAIMLRNRLDIIKEEILVKFRDELALCLG